MATDKSIRHFVREVLDHNRALLDYFSVSTITRDLIEVCPYLHDQEPAIVAPFVKEWLADHNHELPD